MDDELHTQAALDRGVECAAVVSIGQRIALHFLTGIYQVLAQAGHSFVELLKPLLVLAALVRKCCLDLLDRVRQ